MNVKPQKSLNEQRFYFFENLRADWTKKKNKKQEQKILNIGYCG